MHDHRHLLRRAVLLAVLVLAIAARPVRADDLFLSWSRCFGEGAETNRAFACDTNSGTNRIEASFALDAPMDSVAGIETIVDLISQSATLPDWWACKPTGCRAGALSGGFAFDAGNAVCADWGRGLETGFVAAYQQDPPPGGWPYPPSVIAQHARLLLLSAVPVDSARALSAGIQYWGSTVEFSNVQTIGAGSCGGCDVPVCLVLTEIVLVAHAPNPSRTLQTPGANGSTWIRWQGTGADCAAVPVRRRTWGAIKALYR